MTPPPRSLPRRTVLAASGTALLATAAACSSSGTATTTPSTQASAAVGSSTESTPAATPAPSATPSSAASLSSAAAPSSAAAAGGAAPTGTPLASVADVQAAGALIVGPGDAPVLLAAVNGTVVAHTAICTHQGCTVAASGACPCHGSKFNVQTGAVENPPALQPLAAVAVTVSGGQVYPA